VIDESFACFQIAAINHNDLVRFGRADAHGDRIATSRASSNRQNIDLKSLVAIAHLQPFN
jgi:hypothetical protein